MERSAHRRGHRGIAGGAAVKLLQLMIFVIVVAVALQQLWPRLEPLLGGLTGAQAGCLDQSRRLTDDFASKMNRFYSRQSDPDAWSLLRDRLRLRIEKAKEACSCELTSCRRGQQALHQLEQLINQLNLAVIDRGPLPQNPEGVIARIDQLIAEGRELARQGN